MNNTYETSRGTGNEATPAPVYSPPPIPADYLMDYEGESVGPGLPSSAFPFQVFQGGAAAGQSSGGVAGSTAKQIALARIQEVMGGGSADTDPERYSQLLARTFTPRVVEGRVEVDWKPPVWSGTSSPSELEGPALIFYRHAAAAVAQLKSQLGLLRRMSRAGLEKPDACCEDIRNLLASQLDDLLASMSIKNGRSVERVTAGFNSLGDLIDLFETDYIGNDPANQGAEIWCPEDTCRLAQCRVFARSISTLEYQWTKFAEEFLAANGGASLGVALENGRLELEVIASAARDIVQGLHYAGFRKAVTNLELVKPGGSSVAATLNWIENFARQGMQRLQNPGRATVHTLFSEANALQPHVEDFKNWVSKRVVSDLPCQITNLMENSSSGKGQETRDKLAKIRTAKAELEENTRKCEDALHELVDCENKELLELTKKYDSEIKKGEQYGTTEVDSRYEENKKALSEKFEKKRKACQAERETLAKQKQKLDDERAACEREIASIAESVSPLAHGLLSGLRWAMVGIPGAIGVLDRNLKSFAKRMQRLAGNSASPAGGARHRPQIRTQKAPPRAGCQEEGEDVATEYGDENKTEPNKLHSAS